MSRFSNMRISKGGQLLADEWTYDREKEKGSTEKDVDITHAALFHLRSECKLDDGITFKDVLLLVNHINKYELLSPLLTCGPWLKDMVNEGLTGEPREDQSIKNIVLNWHPSVQNDFYNEGRSLFDLYIDLYGETENDQETYGLDFTPIYELKNCTITLDSSFCIYDERSESLEGRREYLDSLSEEEYQKEQYYPTLVKTNQIFTLFDILYGLFWELSFHGGPEDRDTKSAELLETMRKIDSGEEKTIPWEEVKEKLKGDIE